MTYDKFIIILLGILISVAFYCYGYSNGMRYVQKKYEEVIEGYKENFEKAMSISREWKNRCEKLLQEKYSFDNGKEFKNADKN